MISRILAILSALLLTGACNRAGPDSAQADANPGAIAKLSVERGQYLASIMDCSGCHNIGSFSPKPEEGHLQGGTIGFEVPGMGVFYPPNLTPHPDAGIGKWSERDIVTAVRTGRRPDGRILSPAMPWHAYSHLTDEDAAALAAYLKSLPPSPHVVPGPSSKEMAPQPYLTVAPPAKAPAQAPAA
jgi:mono/diheme cytochrome c family protein